MDFGLWLWPLGAWSLALGACRVALISFVSLSNNRRLNIKPATRQLEYRYLCTMHNVCTGSREW
jgi:hypothetical protein